MTAPSTATAIELADAGDAERALAMLQALGDAGDVDALMQHAVWSLAGRHVPRDHAHARSLIRRAVAIGHVDGALMEIALTANGTGGPADWAAARDLLEIAARGDPVAAEHKALVDRMRLRGDGTPAALPAPQILCDAPRVALYPGLLTPDECRHIAGIVGNELEPARVIDPATGRWTAHPVRTSYESAIGPAREDLVIRAINLRVAAASGSEASQGEPLTILRYAPGQEYRPHLDTIAGARNQRIRTVLLYLNEGFRGGETHFPLLDITVVPRGGDALVFDTLLEDGAPDARARHAGLPVVEGAKWLATRWIRARPLDAWTVAVD